MISKTDAVGILLDLRASGVDVKEQLSEVVKSGFVSVEVVKFINKNRPLALTQFYEKLRKSYNDKHSKIYLNIVREITEPYEVLITLSALLTQIMLFSKDIANRQMFLRHARYDEICKVLLKYYNTQDITIAIDLIRQIKADMKVLESCK